MDKKQPTTRAEAREIAIEWQGWQAQQALSYGELVEWHEYFMLIGGKFGLTDEFIENGIL